MSTLPLFEEDVAPEVESLAPGATVLRGFVGDAAPALLADLQAVIERAPFRHLVTRGGFRMSVAMSNCGPWGWVSDRRGYRYEACDPLSGQPWPAMPASFLAIAARAATAAGDAAPPPTACLINRYEPGARMSLHQDRDEGDVTQPIVSISLGVPATFLFGSLSRADRPQRLALRHGDVVVWGGPSRLCFHGVAPLKVAHHPLTGALRFNLTFRYVAARATASHGPHQGFRTDPRPSNSA